MRHCEQPEAICKGSTKNSQVDCVGRVSPAMTSNDFETASSRRTGLFSRAIFYRLVIISSCITDCLIPLMFEFMYGFLSFLPAEAFIMTGRPDLILVIIMNILYFHGQPCWPFPVSQCAVGIIRVAIITIVWIEGWIQTGWDHHMRSSVKPASVSVFLGGCTEC